MGEQSKQWVRVPVEPTPEMIEAAMHVKRMRLLDVVKAIRAGTDETEARTPAISAEWSAMLVAAPKVVREGLTEGVMSDGLLRAGRMLSNCAFNLAQRKSGEFTERDIEALDASRKAWDAASSRQLATGKKQRLTEQQILDGYAAVDVAPTDEPTSIFEAGVRFAECSHGIGIPATGGEGATS